MSEYIHKSHNVSVLMYHFVCPAKYRRVVIDEDVDRVIKETCREIEKRYEIRFIEIGTDRDHVHFSPFFVDLSLAYSGYICVWDFAFAGDMVPEIHYCLSHGISCCIFG